MTESAFPSATPSTPLAPEGDRVRDHAGGLRNEVSGEDEVDRRLAEVEMAGEEVATGWNPAAHAPLSPEVRYLHISRTIHQLITDRNRSVGIFLGVGLRCSGRSVLALERRADVVPMIPMPVDPVLGASR